MPKLTRRNLMKGMTVAMVASPMIVPRTIFGTDKKVAPSERITTGHIGVGGMGGGDLGAVLASKHSHVVAVCDPYEDRRESSAAVSNSNAYCDFRDMFDKEKIDAVVIATPDHWHVPAAIYAGKRKIHAYVQKPLGLTIEQNLAIQKLFHDNNLVFQYGTQQRSIPHCYIGCELVRRGAIGKIQSIEVTAPNGSEGGSAQEAPVPPNFDYDLWLGPAPIVPYAAERCVNPGHFFIYDYSIGYLAGWGAHPLDIMVWADDSDLSGPIEVQGKGHIPKEGLFNNVMNWEMEIMLGKMPLSFKTGGDMTKFYGEDGRWIDIRRGSLSASDPGIIESFDSSATPVLQPSRSPMHEEDFLLAIKDGKPTVTTLKESVRTDNLSHLCDIAVRTNSKVVWDPIKMEFISAPDEAKKMLSRPIRAPWTL